MRRWWLLKCYCCVRAFWGFPVFFVASEQALGSGRCQWTHSRKRLSRRLNSIMVRRALACSSICGLTY